ncbi:hypothetical protein CHUAL_005764 [Chamberlinius hualienensis]
MVGSPSEQLESIKELILFDHIYHKNPKEDDHGNIEILENSNKMDDFTSQINVPCMSLTDTSVIIPSDKQSCEITTAKPPKNEEKSLKAEDDDVVVVYSTATTPPNSRKRTISKTTTEESKFLTKQALSIFSESGLKTNFECLSDSGYESGSSVRSPFSDANSDIGSSSEDMFWDNSLVELFPTLM